MKSYSVTIQIKTTKQYFLMTLGLFFDGLIIFFFPVLNSDSIKNCPACSEFATQELHHSL